MTDITTEAAGYVEAARMLMEGSPWSSKTTFASHDVADLPGAVQTVETLVDMGRDVVLLLFRAGDKNGPVRIGVARAEPLPITIHFGQLWLAPSGERAVLIPKGDSRSFGHYLIEDGRLTHRTGAPVPDLGDGSERATQRLRALAAAPSSSPDPAF